MFLILVVQLHFGLITDIFTFTLIVFCILVHLQVNSFFFFTNERRYGRGGIWAMLLCACVVSGDGFKLCPVVEWSLKYLWLSGSSLKAERWNRDSPAFSTVQCSFKARRVYVCVLCVGGDLQKTVQYNGFNLLPLITSNEVSRRPRSPFFTNTGKHRAVSVFSAVQVS